MTSDNPVIRHLAIHYPNLDESSKRKNYFVSTDDGKLWPFREGDSLALGAGPDYEMVGILELRKRSDEHRTSILRPESFREWIKAFWAWYRGK